MIKESYKIALPHWGVNKEGEDEMRKQFGIDGTEVARVEKVDDNFCQLTLKNGKKVVRAYYTIKTGEAVLEYNSKRWYVNFDGDVATPQKREVEVTIPTKVKTDPTKHHQFEIIKTCIKSDIPVYLVGDAGTGKNYTLQEIASELNLEFYFTNSVQQEYKITGFIDAGGVYHETEFYKAFTQGGLFFLDEIDASIPEVLVLLNAAIANRYFEFPNGKQNAHPDFRVVSAGNTVGSGANEMYTGRMMLDQATLDRFVVIEFDYDKNIELMLAKGNTALVGFIRSLRDFTKKNGIRATFSYRAIISVVKLEEAGLPLDQILKIAVFKGMDKDTLRTLRVSDAGKYYFALQKLQQVA